MKVKTHKKRLLLPIFGVIALSLVGITFAFNRDFSIFNNLFNLGSDEGIFTESFESPDGWTPCAETPKTATATNPNSTPRYVRMKIDDYWRTKDSQTSEDDHTTSDLPKSWTDDQSKIHNYADINFQNKEDWAHGDDDWYYYRNALGANETTSSLLKSVTFNCEVNLSGEVVYSADGKVGVSGDNDYADARYHVYVTFQMRAEEWDYEEMPENIVARIERTGKLYGSIMAAEAKAIAGDTITLLADTEEVVTNEKQVTLDLNGHTVTGSLTNTASGNITLINGEINNPNGIAVTNRGTLTIGIDDYDPDTGVALIDNNNIRLIGTTAALKQDEIDNYKFYFYDGYLEGDIGIVGGYDGAPKYHSVEDARDVYFFPNVEHRETTDRDYQHIELKGSDNVVSKTSVHGDIYYYNLQDNINTSAQTGYKIYAVRDFPASYNINIPADSDIIFDTVGYNISLNNNISIDGSWTIENSQSTVDETTGAVTYAGAISTQQTITGDGNLTLKNSKVQNVANTNTLLFSGGSLTMRGATITTNNGIVINVKSGATYDIDNTSYITRTSSDHTAIYNTTTDFVWDTGGNIRGNFALQNAAGAKATIKNGTWRGREAAIDNSTSAVVTIDGGTFTAEYAGIRQGQTTMNGGSIVLSYNRGLQGVILSEGGASFTMNGGNINISNPSTGAQTQTGIYARTNSPVKINGGTITMTAQKGTSYGVYDYAGVVTVSGDANISATCSSGNGVGFYARSGNSHITSGTIYGSKYGAQSENQSAVIIIGTNDDTLSKASPSITGGDYALYGGAFQFYDGILKANTATTQDGIIQAMPEGTYLYDTTGTEYAHESWLEEDEAYLAVGDVEYNSLSKAYAAITGDSGTIRVIKDAVIPTTIPASPAGKDITINLDGHVLTYAQALTIATGSTITIKDDSVDKTGAIHNSTTNHYTIVNHGTLNLQSGLIDSKYDAVFNQNGTFNMSGGTINCIRICVWNYAPNSGDQSIINLSGGEIAITSTATNEEQEGVRNYGGVTNITGGLIRIERATGTNGAYGIREQTNHGGTTTIDAGEGNTAILINVPTSNAYGVFDSVTYVLSGEIHVTGGGSQIIGSWARSTNTIRGGKIVATGVGNANKNVYGFQGNSTVSGGEIVATTEYGNAYGGHNESIYSNFPISGGTISGTSINGTGYGAFVGNSAAHITGGTIYGSHYGAYSNGTRHTKTIGVNDGTIDKNALEIIGGLYAIYGNYFYFYDGTLRGQHAYQDGIISAIPTGTQYHIEASAEYDENCWLMVSPDYLQVGEATFNSLQGAFSAITGSSGTIKVIADASDEATSPALPSGKEITFDINGHNVNYTQPLLVNTDSAILNIVDNSTNQDGRLNNSNSAQPTIRATGGTVNIISGTISSNSIAISTEADRNPTVNISGGTINCGTSCIYASRAKVNITGGLIEPIDNGSSAQSGISGSGTITQTGGLIRITRNASSSNTNAIAAYTGINNLTINKTGSEPAAYVNAQNGANAYGIEKSNSTLQNGIIDVTGYTAYGIKCSFQESFTLNGGTITVNGYKAAYGTSMGRGTINNIDMTVNSQTNTAYGIWVGTNTYVGIYYYSIVNLNNGNISVTSQADNAYGVYVYNGGTGYVPTFNMTGGALTSSAPNGTSYGGYSDLGGRTDITTRINLTGGAIKGGDYGIYTAAASTTVLGNNDGTLDDTTPIINGGEYGLYGGKITFYDGKIRGTLNALNDIRIVKTIADDAMINTSSEVIDGDTYDVKTLVAPHNVAQIGSIGYTSIANAIAASNVGDTIELLEDNYIYGTLAIPSDKDVIIDTAGFEIITGSQIINNGTVTITNSAYPDQKPTLRYAESSYFITNNADATMTLEKLAINAAYGVNNIGTLTINDMEITASTTAFKNTGTATGNNLNFNSNTYAYYNDGGSSSITSLTSTNGQIYNNSGELTLINSNSTISKSSPTTNILTNNGTASLVGTTLSIDNSGITQAWVEARTIYNTSTLNITQNSNISIIWASSGWSNTIRTIHSNGGTVTIADSDIVLTGGSNDTIHTIYNPTGTTNVLSGDIRCTSTNLCTGIATDTGTITLGEAEPSDSQDWGQPTAHVSTTNPAIYSTHTGVSFGNGHVNFYDGVIAGKNTAINKDPSVVEYLWHVISGTDADNYKYIILQYMQ